VRVTNVGGAGAPTAEGIKLIDVQGASDGTFALQGDYVFQGEQAVVAGAYGYRLYKDGNASVDGDWYLRSALVDPDAEPDPGTDEPQAPLYQPGVPIYEAYAGMLQHANSLDTLVQRTGNRASTQAADGSASGNGVWVRVQGADQRFRPEVTTSGTDYDVQAWTSELGVDTPLSESTGGRLVGGATLRYGRYDTDASSQHGNGRIRTDGYGVGISLTWYDESGFYADGQARWNRFDSDLRSTALGQLLESGNDAKSYAWGVEIGQKFATGEHVSLVPQAQVTWGEAKFDQFDDAFDVHVSHRDGKVATARAGLAVDWRGVRVGASGAIDTHVYAIANLYRNLRDNVWLDVAGTRLDTRNERDWAGFGVGGSLDWAGGRYSLYGEVTGRTGLTNGDSDAVNATLGFRTQW
jgi:fibronectin-binding autotransporter adhesin